MEKNRYLLLLLIFISFPYLKVTGQVDILNHVRANSFYVGWDGTGSNTGPLDIKNGFNDPIDFYVNSTKFFQILTTGDLNVVVPTVGYMINNSYVLRHNNIPSSIYLGVGAGNTNATNSNTFLGFETGMNSGNTSTQSTEGSRNTFVGFSAGRMNDKGDQNSFFGYNAGYNTTGTTGLNGHNNTFLGASAGFSNVIGNSNTFAGWEAGYMSTGNWNTMVGRAAGHNAVGVGNCYFGKDAAQSISGDGNCFFGNHAGNADPAFGNYNSGFGIDAGRYCQGGGNSFFGGFSGDGAGNTWVGGYNSFYGYGSGQGGNILGTTTLYYSGGFGYNAIATSNHKIIIGTNAVFNEPIHVGIGLSNDLSIHLGPRSPLEINADHLSTTIPTHPSAGSGLQFRQLTSLSPTGTNSPTYVAPYGKVLTVDEDGKVKLTDDEGGNQFGYGFCPVPSLLPQDISMEMNDNRIYYEGQGYSEKHLNMNNSIGLGYKCGEVLPGKLSVNQTYAISSVNYSTIAGYFHNGDITSESTEFLGGTQKKAVYGNTDGYSAGESTSNIGGEFEATNSETVNIGVNGLTGSSGQVITYGSLGIGGRFVAKKAKWGNIGVAGVSDGSGNTQNYGVYGSAPLGTCSNGGPCSNAAAFFNGDVFSTSGNYLSSDIRLKDNFHPIENALSLISLLNPKTFSYRQNQYPNIVLPEGIQGGLIAQEVQTVLPNLVSSFRIPPRIDSTGMDTTGSNTPYLSVNYTGLIPYLIQAIKEQKQSIDSLRTQLREAEVQINNCCSGLGQRLANPDPLQNEEIEPVNLERNEITTELSDSKTIILNQNSPNPFSEETFIKYFVPESINNAFIMIYDYSGQVLKTIRINERGLGTLHVYSENLSTGIYSYSLIADGKTIDTKKMICQK